MGRIATRADVNSLFGTNAIPLSQCPKKSDILYLAPHACIKGDYSYNQAVQLDDIVVLKENVISFEMWSSSTVRWSSTYPLASTIIAHVGYVDFNIQTRDYAILCSAGKSGDREELAYPMREFKSVYINIKQDETYYYTVKKY